MAGYFTDPALTFSDGQAITATADSTNVVDLQSSPTLRDLGIRPMVLELIVTEAFDNLTSLAFSLKSDSTTNLDTSETVHITDTKLLAALTLGAKFSYTLPIGQSYERYLGIEYTVTGTAPTVGKVKAFLSPSVANVQYFPDGSSIA